MKHAIFQYYLNYNGVGKQGAHYSSEGVPEWAQRSVEYFRKYASLHDADYYFYTDRFVNATSNFFEALRVYKDPIFDQYDKVLYSDVDVMPKNMTNSIFEVSIGDVAGWAEWPHPALDVPVNWCETPALKQRFADFGAVIPKSKTSPSMIRIVNSGVVLWSKEARLKARKQFDDHEKWFKHKNPLLDPSIPASVAGHSSHCLDQPYLNAMWTKFKFDVTELPIEWNRFPTKDENFPCNFAHYLQNYRVNVPTMFEKLP